MSYSIFYERAFIRIGDNGFIPLVNSGCNNCFTVNWNGREVAEREWSVLNWKHENKLIFTAPEIATIAREYDDYNRSSGMLFKTRHRPFAPGEFERWVINGMKHAYTIEEYVSFGNGFHVLERSGDAVCKWPMISFCTSEGLLQILGGHSTTKALDIRLDNKWELYRPKAPRVRRPRPKAHELHEYYTLEGEDCGRIIYLAALTRRGGYRYAFDAFHPAVKVFLTEKDALRYQRQYPKRLSGFKPKYISKTALCT